MDFSIFEEIDDDDHCDGKHHGYCKAVGRVTAALNYYHILFITPLSAKYGKDPESMFEAFIRDLYPRRKLLDDYIHWVLHHLDPDSLLKLRRKMQLMCDRVNDCRATTRHYRDRRNDGNGVESNWSHEIMDRIHFNVYHLEEVGLRVPKEAMESELASNDDGKVRVRVGGRVTEEDGKGG